MAHTAYLPIIADRYGAVVRHIFVVGLDLTGLDMRAQVHLYGDVPGVPLVDLTSTANGNAEGLRLVEVSSDGNGLPTSHVELVINETTMEALPYAGEIGDVTTLAWDWQVTIAGRKRRLAKGEFQITGDGVTGASGAPANRVAPYGLPQRPVIDVWSSARMTFGEEQVTVQIDGADLVAPLTKKATDAATSAQDSRDKAALSAGAAQGTARYFTTRAAGEAASATDQSFATDDGAGNVIYYRRTAGGSVEIGRAVTPAALADGGGAARIGFDRSRPSVPATVIDRLLRDLYITDAPYSVPLDNTPADTQLQALIDGLDRSGGAGWNLIMPRGRLRLTKRLTVPSRTHISGDFFRSGIVSLDGQDAGFIYNGVEYSGLHRLRIGLGGLAGMDAIQVRTTNRPTANLDFSDMEIAGAAIAGQRGFNIEASNGWTIEECSYTNMRFFTLDQPLREIDVEGSKWTSCFINNFSYSAGKPALDLRTLASSHDFDVRAQPAAGATAYYQRGAGNFANLVADIRAQAKAIQLTNTVIPGTAPSSGSTPNIVIVRRPENLTPLGDFTPGNTVIDGSVFAGARILTRGTQPTGAAFVMDGFGNQAYVEVKKGDDQAGRFVIHSAGAGMSATPTVTYFNVDGPYSFSPSVLLIQRNGGNQPTANRTIDRNCDINGWNFKWDSTPISGEAYEFDYVVR